MTKMNVNAGTGDLSTGTSLHTYYNASQLRADAWNRVKDNTARLAEASGRKAETGSVRLVVEQDLRLLEPVESYWAFPGKHCMAHLWGLFDGQEYTALAHINRALVSEFVPCPARTLRPPA
jgi:arginine decarboxylase